MDTIGGFGEGAQGHARHHLSAQFSLFSCNFWPDFDQVIGKIPLFECYTPVVWEILDPQLDAVL